MYATKIETEERHFSFGQRQTIIYDLFDTIEDALFHVMKAIAKKEQLIKDVERSAGYIKIICETKKFEQKHILIAEIHQRDFS